MWKWALIAAIVLAILVGLWVFGSVRETEAIAVELQPIEHVQEHDGTGHDGTAREHHSEGSGGR